ncbi:hypothetical protein WG78_15665 [Amantichitinum ursilacus]|uniref:Uncharacterized protein n=1 Tax=Amantichitinum ursilacus TaxID=857265 RepID=A0A0N0XJB7_9NEIS|nr:hypothetical protein WG78_15665 [Amantichitinum ursilacus]
MVRTTSGVPAGRLLVALVVAAAVFSAMLLMALLPLTLLAPLPATTGAGMTLAPPARLLPRVWPSSAVTSPSAPATCATVCAAALPVAAVEACSSTRPFSSGWVTLAAGLYATAGSEPWPSLPVCRMR